MTPEEYRDLFATALDMWDAIKPRSLQTGLGVSDIGSCHEKARRKLLGEPATDFPASRAAQHGTAIHASVAEARQWANPRLILDADLTITLPSGRVLRGHPDEIDPDEPSVTDTKTVADEAELRRVEKNGATEQQRFQRHLYALGAIQAGLVAADGLIVRNVWLDRAGQSQHPHVEQEPFSMAVVHEADRWLGDAAWAAEHGEEALRDKHFSWCMKFCEYATACRGGPKYPDLIVTDPELVSAALDYAESHDQEKRHGKIAKAAREALKPLQFAAGDDLAAYQLGEVRVRWIPVNADHPYHRLEVEPVKEGAA